jgi:aldose 1-epimerase
MKRIFLFQSIIFVLGVLTITSACTKKEIMQVPGTVTKTSFGLMTDSTQVNLYTLVNRSGITMKVTNYGGIITSLMVPDKNGNPADIVLGYDSLSGYLKATPYFGALIGRYGNRLAKGKFTLDGTEYILAQNDGPNHLHGGVIGYDKVVWEAEDFKTDSAVGLKLHYLSKDGEEGYPGNLDITVTYTLSDNNTLTFDYTATTDKATPVNLTQHSYFNLAGSGDVKSHELMIAASKYNVVDSTLIPTGELRDVKGSPFDFTTVKPIGKDLVAAGGKPIGYDHNFILDTKSINDLAVRVVEPTSGRIMEVYTDQPGVQFYSGNFLDGTITAKGGNVINQYNGFCLETQHFPDSPNQPEFPSTILKPGEKYHTTTIYKFSAK